MWLSKGNLKRQTESFLIAAQNNVIRTNYIETKILYQPSLLPHFLPPGATVTFKLCSSQRMPPSQSLKLQLSGNTCVLLGEMVIKSQPFKRCQVCDWSVYNGNVYPTLRCLCQTRGITPSFTPKLLFISKCLITIMTIFSKFHCIFS